MESLRKRMKSMKLRQRMKLISIQSLPRIPNLRKTMRRHHKAKTSFTRRLSLQMDHGRHHRLPPTKKRFHETFPHKSHLNVPIQRQNPKKHRLRAFYGLKQLLF